MTEGGSSNIEHIGANGTLRFYDSKKATFGTGDDLSIYHDGTNTTIDNNTGQFNLDGASGNAIRFLNNGTYQCQIGSAGLDLPDTKKIRIGDSEDLEIQHDGTNNLIKTTTSAEIQILFNAETMARFIPNGAVELYHDNEKKLYTYTDGVFVQDDSSAGAYLVIATNAGTQGSLYGTSNTLGLLDGQNHYMIKGVKDGAVELYHNNVKTFETRSDGVTLTGQMVQTSSSARALALNRQGSAGEMILFDFQGTKCGAINVNTNSTEYATTGSDITLKKNFELWDENVLNLFKNINPQKFHFNNQEDTEKKHKGFIAQEMVNSFPEAYTKDDKDKYWFNPSGMVVYLMKSVQELSVENAALKARLDAAGL